MGRTAQPWFDKQKNQWTVWFNGRRERLATGRKNKQAAKQRLAELQLCKRRSKSAARDG